MSKIIRFHEIGGPEDRQDRGDRLKIDLFKKSIVILTYGVVDRFDYSPPSSPKPFYRK